jgi:hypothetical protein
MHVIEDQALVVLTSRNEQHPAHLRNGRDWLDQLHSGKRQSGLADLQKRTTLSWLTDGFKEGVRPMHRRRKRQQEHRSLHAELQPLSHNNYRSCKDKISPSRHTLPAPARLSSRPEGKHSPGGGFFLSSCMSATSISLHGYRNTAHRGMQEGLADLQPFPAPPQIRATASKRGSEKPHPHSTTQYYNTTTIGNGHRWGTSRCDTRHVC